MNDSTPPPTDALTAATQMVKNGRLDLARETLMQYLVKNPSSEQAWLLMSYVLPDPAKQKDCLERVLKINPNNTVAQSKLAHLLGRRTEELFKRKVEPPASIPAAPEPEPSPEPAPNSALEPEPAPSAVSEPVAGAEEPVLSPPPATPPRSLTATEISSATRKNPLFSGKGFRIVTIGLVALILIILAAILYISVVGPMIQSLTTPPTATPEPIAIPTYPPEWTQTPTSTVTPIPPTITPTETPTPTLSPSETTIP